MTCYCTVVTRGVYVLPLANLYVLTTYCTITSTVQFVYVSTVLQNSTECCKYQ